MKTLITILVSIFFVSATVAEDAMKELKITREWKVNSNSTVELNAEKQSYKVEFWDKNIVRIESMMKTNKSNLTTADFEEMLEIGVNITRDKLTIHTTLNTSKTNGFWDWIMKAKDKITKGAQYNERNIIYLPKNLAQLNFDLNYSELSIGEMNIPLKISSNYGVITIQKNKNKTVINSSYADINLGELSNVKINSTYGDFIIDNIDTLNSSTSYCDIKLSNCPYIQSLSTNYGDITIQKAGYIKAAATYSDIKIKSLQQELNTTLTYSDLTIDDISKNLRGMSVVSTHSNSKIKINPETPITIKIKDMNSDIDIQNARLQLNISKNETGTLSEITAKTKTATDASPVIKINSITSDIIIY